MSKEDILKILSNSEKYSGIIDNEIKKDNLCSE